MSQLITIEKSVLDDIFSQLASLKKEVAILKSKVLKKKPKEGSEEWWDMSLMESREDYRTGNYKTYDNPHDLIADLEKGI